MLPSRHSPHPLWVTATHSLRVDINLVRFTVYWQDSEEGLASGPQAAQVTATGLICNDRSEVLRLRVYLSRNWLRKCQLEVSYDSWEVAGVAGVRGGV